MSISYEGYSTYNVNCQITPIKEFDYPEMTVIFYDADNAVVDKSPLVWNTNSPAKTN